MILPAGIITSLYLLDLSAAFDTIHFIESLEIVSGSLGVIYVGLNRI